MREEVILFTTAKLACEKGFHFMKSNIYGDNLHYHRDDPDGKPSAKNSNIVRGTYLAPTQSLLQKWLRDTHNMHILLNVGMNNGVKQTFYCNVCLFGENLYKSMFRGKTSVCTYEEALEEGLKQALNLITTQNES